MIQGYQTSSYALSLIKGVSIDITLPAGLFHENKDAPPILVPK
jgi:hypothetical protein